MAGRTKTGTNMEYLLESRNETGIFETGERIADDKQEYSDKTPYTRETYTRLSHCDFLVNPGEAKPLYHWSMVLIWHHS